MSKKSLEYYLSLEYNVIIKKQEDDGETWYVAYCNELGINACHGIGDDKISALRSFIEEKDAFIKFLYEKNEPIPEVVNEDLNASGIFSVRTSPWIHSALVKQSKVNGVSLNCFINQLLAYGVAQSEVNNKCERLIGNLEEKINVQNENILDKLKSISYRTQSMFEQSPNFDLVGKGIYSVAI